MCRKMFCIIKSMTERMTHIRKVFVLMLLMLIGAGTTFAQERKLQNKPYIDQRRLHYGFFIGMHDQGLSLENTGAIDPATGKQWTVKNDRANFGFHVGVLGELKLHENLALRVVPTLYFGSKHFEFFDQSTGEKQSQDMKSTYIAVPVHLKVTAPRWNNYRPYVVGGVNMAYDLTTGKHTLLRTNAFNPMVEVGLGCDFYLPFFKLIPELKFSFGLGNVLDKKRDDLMESSDIIYTNAVNKATTNMVTLTLYFE